MAAVLWSALEQLHGIRRDAPLSWTLPRPTGLSAVVPPHAFDAMASPVVRAVLDQLLQGRWRSPTRWGVPLVSFPEHGRVWDVPHEQWHLDSPVNPPVSSEPPRIARVFVLLSALHPQGGGTLVVTGSHRVLQQLATHAGKRLASAEAKRLLWAQHPWFAELAAPCHKDRVAHFMNTSTEVDGVAVRVAEMTGEPGDLYLMHPSSLHAPSLNASAATRLVLTQWIEAGVPG